MSYPIVPTIYENEDVTVIVDGDGHITVTIQPVTATVTTHQANDACAVLNRLRNSIQDVSMTIIEEMGDLEANTDE